MEAIINHNDLSVDRVLDNELETSTEPLVVELKNGHRLQRIRASMSAAASIQFATSPIARILRRDWNIVSAKLFLNCLDPDWAKLVREDAAEMTWQMSDLLDIVKSLPVGQIEHAWMRPRKINLQIVHPICAQWLRAFTKYDQAYTILINAQKSGRMQPKQRWALTLPSQMAYMGFKARAMKLPLKSTTELLEEAGL
ncbi:hypothetical protein [Hydrogenophaga sp. NFH-34]|uniref:hypothetical protein n=1 Tax=Hydrogenophaga sp. NFH-34 TaxID=2744446 RepID=UPI001F19ECA2|nr:hypothetical protein [Hydrogenophaga sp. NFH-34]